MMGRRFLCCGCFGQPPGSWGDRGWVQRHKATLFITKLCFASKQPFPYPVTEATFQFLLSFICLTQLSQKGYSDTETFQGHLSIVSPAHCWGKSNKKTHPNPWFSPPSPPRRPRRRATHVPVNSTSPEPSRCSRSAASPGSPGAARRGADADAVVWITWARGRGAVGGQNAVGSFPFLGLLFSGFVIPYD